jgi:protein involved in polysaccharide export with SLBB domain
MNPGEARSSRRAPPARGLLVLALAAALAGCATDRASIEKNLMADRHSARRSAGVAENYRVACPDVLEVRVADRPELSATYVIGSNGRIDVGDYGALRVEGRTLPEVAGLIADETGQPPAGVEVRVADFRSQQLFLSGQVVGWQRTVPYRGQETVLDLLQRVGGITPGAEPGDVYVVRTHLGDNQRPEVLHVDLKAIVMRRDDRTNLRLMPFDQVYVGGTRQAEVEKSFPPWLRPVYQAIWNMLPTAQRRAPPEPPAASRWVTGS